MSIPIAGPQEPPAYSSSVSPSNPSCNRNQHPPLAQWQRRWNVEWLNEAMIPDLKSKFLRVQWPRYRKRGCTREQVDAKENQIGGIIAEMIEAGLVNKENELKRTRFHCAIRRFTWPLQLMVHEVKAFRKCWYEFKNKDKLWRVTAVMEEQGESPRWQAEMTFSIRPTQYEQMKEAGQWFEFPSPEDIKWFYVTGPDGVKRLHATDQKHWGPNPYFLAASLPFGERNGCIVRHPISPTLPLTRDFHLFVEQTGARRCNQCGCLT
ncbi:hypothetical protein FHL15_009767 [Xylaria flabelliformis]|uniref:Uncharacterized protein n=1 Tax=Xylaria flabelliformis TaxID=2512241 RepID=A0A553HMZ7_9PEZI|nr:hypothetical protein FHL15_009767 [Xylaria flabelliformis]